MYLFQHNHEEKLKIKLTGGLFTLNSRSTIKIIVKLTIHLL